jgi:hypothetical protein
MYEELIINGNLHNQIKGKLIFQNINKNINKLFRHEMSLLFYNNIKYYLSKINKDFNN